MTIKIFNHEKLSDDVKFNEKERKIHQLGSELAYWILQIGIIHDNNRSMVTTNTIGDCGIKYIDKIVYQHETKKTMLVFESEDIIKLINPEMKDFAHPYGITIFYQSIGVLAYICNNKFTEYHYSSEYIKKHINNSLLLHEVGYINVLENNELKISVNQLEDNKDLKLTKLADEHVVHRLCPFGIMTYLCHILLDDTIIQPIKTSILARLLSIGIYKHKQFIKQGGTISFSQIRDEFTIGLLELKYDDPNDIYKYLILFTDKYINRI